MAEQRLLTKQEYAEYWQVSAGAVDKWVQAGKIKVIRTPGGSPRFYHPEDERGSPYPGLKPRRAPA